MKSEPPGAGGEGCLILRLASVLNEKVAGT